METRTQVVDRVLEALSPALASELERVVHETRQAIEADFERRLQSAVRDAEESARSAAEIERQQAVDRAIKETRQTVQKQVIDELQAQFTRTLASREDELRKAQAEFSRSLDEFKKSENEWNGERERLRREADRWRTFAEAQGQLNESSSQPEMLMRCLRLAEPFAASVAVYTSKSDGLAFWKSRGKTVFPEIISQQTTDPESYFKPIVVRGKTVAAVCALPPFQAEALDFIAGSMERAIELFALKLAFRAT